MSTRMKSHELTLRSGATPDAAYAKCVCGWRGPDRNVNDENGRRLVQIDESDHRIGLP